MLPGRDTWERPHHRRLDVLYAGVANYQGTVTFHFATLEEQYLAR